MQLFQLQSELADVFTKHFLLEKDLWTNYGYSDLVFGTHLIKNELSKILIVITINLKVSSEL